MSIANYLSSLCQLLTISLSLSLSLSLFLSLSLSRTHNLTSRSYIAKYVILNTITYLPANVRYVHSTFFYSFHFMHSIIFNIHCYGGGRHFTSSSPSSSSFVYIFLFIFIFIFLFLNILFIIYTYCSTIELILFCTFRKVSLTNALCFNIIGILGCSRTSFVNAFADNSSNSFKNVST
jgi:hypothetical protein